MSYQVKKILISSDHAGFSLKTFLIKELTKSGFEPVDLGCDSAEKSVDYPDYAKALCTKLKDEFGILICGSGIGISIAANRFPHIRAALCYNSKSAKLARAHNDANVLCLGARVVASKQALMIAKAFLQGKFEGGRHATRVCKINS
ncbi:MAG: ribose 5-phosphate isomerase B [Alphaproteobacteria bacterium]|nr:ribose 5-phosphate isomerase B [Alphaproteobacteria bacterium]